MHVFQNDNVYVLATKDLETFYSHCHHEVWLHVKHHDSLCDTKH